MKILINAIDDLIGCGWLTFKSYTKRLGEIGADLGRNPTNHFRIGETVVMVEVEDTGTGIPENQIAKVLDPFFTTKPTGKGTGLGLSVTNKIIELHGGILDIRNLDEGGVRATVILKANGREER